MLNIIFDGRKFFILALVLTVFLSFGVLTSVGEEGNRKNKPEVTDPWCTVSDCETFCTKDGPGAWYCYAHTEAQHYDEFGNPQPLTAIAQAAGTAVCFYSVVCAGPEEYYKSGSASEGGWGTASVTATVYVEGIACHSNCNNYCENEGDCNCTS